MKNIFTCTVTGLGEHVAEMIAEGTIILFGEEALRCYDCKSPERICNGLSVLWRPLGGAGETMVLLVDEDLGY